jgi:O-antigen/teichoic acid export membrane protein
VEGFGQYGFAVALIGFFSVISDFGLFQIQIRETSIHSEGNLPGQYITSSLIAKTILGFISLIIVLVIAIFSHKPTDVKLLLCFLGVSMFITNLFGSYTAVLVGQERFLVFGVISAIYVFAYSSLAIFALLDGFGLVGIGISQMIVAVAVAITGTIFISIKILKAQGKPDLARGFDFFKMAAPLGLTAILVTIYHRTDFILLSYIKGDQEVGYYNAAYTLVNSLLLFATTFTSTLLPRLSALFAADFEVLGKLYRTAFKYLLFVGVGSAVGAMILAGPILNFVFGGKFLPGAAALSILVWASALMFVNSLQGSLLVASNMKNQLVHLTAAAAVANVALNIILIPAYGIKGAAIAVVVSEFIAGSWSYILLRKHNPPLFLSALLSKSLVASTVMAAAVIFLPISQVLLRVLIGIGIYAVGLIAVKGFDSRDLKIIRDVIGLKKPEEINAPLT